MFIILHRVSRLQNEWMIDRTILQFQAANKTDYNYTHEVPEAQLNNIINFL